MTSGSPFDTPGPQLDDLARRLRAWSSASWAHADRLAVMRRALQHLADDAARAAGRDVRPLPTLAPTSLADQLLVLARQAEQDGVDPSPHLAGIAAALGFRERLSPTRRPPPAPV